LDGIVENLALFWPVKYIAFGIFSQKEFATLCTGGNHQWMKHCKFLEIFYGTLSEKCAIKYLLSGHC